MMKAGIQAEFRSDSWQCGGDSGSAWIKGPAGLAVLSPLGIQKPIGSSASELLWACTVSTVS